MSIRKQIKQALREGLLTESMDVIIKGYDYDNALGSISDILHFLNREVNNYLVDLIGEERYEEYRTDGFFAYDGGSNPYEDVGTINFYTWAMPEELVRHTCKYIAKILMEDRGIILDFKFEKSGSQNSDVVRINIRGNNNEVVPQMNLSNRNAEFFFVEVLKYSKREFEMGSFSVDDILTRIEFASQNMDATDYQDAPIVNRAGKHTEIVHGYNENDVTDRLDFLRRIAEFAKSNGYHEIAVY